MKAQRIAGWVLSVLLVVFLCGPSAMGKFTDWEGKEEMFEKIGLTDDLVRKIGVLEIAIAIPFLIPRTAFVSAILMTGYLGGAVITHLRIGEPFYFPVILGVLLWCALGLRRPEVFQLAVGQRSTPPKDG
ncbi:MAG: DoxX family protein [Planctomycetaceae bacterium]|nr:DoxX family protein [Planctomycetaceae bacterium]